MEKATSAAQDETQRALTLEQLIYQRNKQIADIIQMLATSFDLGERPLLATEDVKADLLWQQHTKVVTQLIERLRTEQQAKKELQQTYQAETAKLAEKEILLVALQSTLDNHTTQLSKLERVLEEQKSILQQQNNTQQVLSDTLKNYQPPVAPPAKPIQEAIKPFVQFEAKSYATDNLYAQTAPQSQPIEAPKVADQKTLVEPVKIIEAVAPVNIDTKPATTHEEVPHSSLDIEQQSVIPAKNSLGKIKGLFGKKQAPVKKVEPEEPPYASLDIEQQPVIPAKDSLGKIKNMFGKKQIPVKTEPQWTAEKPVEPEAEALPLPAETEQHPDEIANKAPGKLQGLYSKFLSKGK
jgi:hypothetical protein